MSSDTPQRPANDVQDVFSPSAEAIHAPKPRRMSRAPPPHILIRTATDAGPPAVEIDNEEAQAEETEAGDTVPDLTDIPATPNKRHSLNLSGDRPITPTGVDGRRSPMSPSWAPLEASPRVEMREFGTSPRPRPPSWHRGSLEVPSFYMPPSPSESKPARSFEPTPQHGLHSRNLSAYFPHPGMPARVPSPTPVAPAGDSVIPDADKSSYGAGADYAAQSPAEESTERPRAGKRRGHHVSRCFPARSGAY